MTQTQESDTETLQETPPGFNRAMAELKREVVESRNLVIKHDNLIKSLLAEIKGISKRNDEHYRRTWLASGVAYAVFAVLAVALGVVGARAAIGSEQAKVELAQGQAAESKKQAELSRSALEAERAAAAAQKSASHQALLAFRQLGDSRLEIRMKGLDALLKIDAARLSEFERASLDAASRALKSEVSESALDKAKSAFRRQDMQAATQSFERFFAFHPQNGPRASEENNAHFLAGAAYFELKAFEKAQAHLEHFVAAGKQQKNHAYGVSLLGQSYEQLQQPEKAIQTYERGLQDHPEGEYSSLMQRRRQNLKSAAKAAATAPQPAP